MSRPVERPLGQQFLHRPDLEGKIAFEKVSFAYPGAPVAVLKDVSFEIRPGEKVGICLLYTSDAADERSSVDLGGRRIIKKKKKHNIKKRKKNNKHKNQSYVLQPF